VLTANYTIHALFVHLNQPTVITGVRRQTIPFRNLSLTPIKIDYLPRAVRVSTLISHFEKQEIMKKWKATSWAKKLERQHIRRNLTDFDRFKLMIARKKKRDVINREVAKLKKAANISKSKEKKAAAK